jgi:large subunit ribosomal protein L3
VLGCMTYFNKFDKLAYPATMIKVPMCVISAVRKKEIDGYNGIQVVFDRDVVREKVLSKPLLGALKKLNLPILRYSKEFVFDTNECGIESFEVGTRLRASVFENIRKVSVSGLVKGRGFTGAMKRWGFAGLEASHGVSVSHRSLGGTGQRTDPGKVFKNKKMAGRHGMFQKTVLLDILDKDFEEDIIIVKGAVPGAINSFVFLRETGRF